MGKIETESLLLSELTINQTSQLKYKLCPGRPEIALRLELYKKTNIAPLCKDNLFINSSLFFIVSGPPTLGKLFLYILETVLPPL